MLYVVRSVNVDVLTVGILLCDWLEIILRKFTELILLSGNSAMGEHNKLCCLGFGKTHCL